MRKHDRLHPAMPAQCQVLSSLTAIPASKPAITRLHRKHRKHALRTDELSQANPAGATMQGKHALVAAQTSPVLWLLPIRDIRKVQVADGASCHPGCSQSMPMTLLTVHLHLHHSQNHQAHDGRYLLSPTLVLSEPKLYCQVCDDKQMIEKHRSMLDPSDELTTRTTQLPHRSQLFCLWQLAV